MVELHSLLINVVESMLRIYLISMQIINQIKNMKMEKELFNILKEIWQEVDE